MHFNGNSACKAIVQAAGDKLTRTEWLSEWPGDCVDLLRTSSSATAKTITIAAVRVFVRVVVNRSYSDKHLTIAKFQINFFCRHVSSI